MKGWSILVGAERIISWITSERHNSSRRLLHVLKKPLWSRWCGLFYNFNPLYTAIVMASSILVFIHALLTKFSSSFPWDHEASSKLTGFVGPINLGLQWINYRERGLNPHIYETLSTLHQTADCRHFRISKKYWKLFPRCCMHRKVFYSTTL